MRSVSWNLVNCKTYEKRIRIDLQWVKDLKNTKRLENRDIR